MFTHLLCHMLHLNSKEKMQHNVCYACTDSKSAEKSVRWWQLSSLSPGTAVSKRTQKKSEVKSV